LKKPDNPVPGSRYSSFCSFRENSKKGDNTKRSRIQWCIERWNGRKKQRRLEPKAEVVKIGYSGLEFRMVRFFLNR
jgi:hypothetical protein